VTIIITADAQTTGIQVSVQMLQTLCNERSISNIRQMLPKPLWLKGWKIGFKNIGFGFLKTSRSPNFSFLDFFIHCAIFNTDYI